jgi:hypothetical protein
MELQFHPDPAAARKLFLNFVDGIVLSTYSVDPFINVIFAVPIIVTCLSK